MRRAITTATHRIDEELRHDPENQGESRSSQERVYFEFPLGIRFEIDRQQSLVHVLQVWSFRKRG
jgi:hypothetical protein